MPTGASRRSASSAWATPARVRARGRRPPAPPRDSLDRRGIGPRYLLYPAQFWAPEPPHVVRGPRFARRLVRARLRGSEGTDSTTSELCAPPPPRLGVAERVHFLGFVPRSQLTALSPRPPSRTWLFGRRTCPARAMALGCPVVAAECPGRLSIWVTRPRVEPLDPAAVAGAVRELEDGFAGSAGDAAASVPLASRRSATLRGLLTFADEFEGGGERGR